MFMRDVSNLCVRPESKIRDVLEIIDKGSIKLAVVIDDNDRVIGTVSDGDIRRALLSGKNLIDPIREVYNSKPILAYSWITRAEMIEMCSREKVSQIPVLRKDQTLETVYCLGEIFKEKSNAVVLMVGGEGKRLLPLTETTPKPMLHVGGKPILETIVSNFKRAGYKNFIFCVNYQSDKIRQYFKDGASLGVHISYVEEEKKMGTAGALSLLKEKLTEPFYVMNGDLLTNLDLKDFHDYHVDNQSFATMAVREYDFEVPYGVVRVEKNEIKCIDEKPIQRFFVNAGIYMFSPEILDFLDGKESLDMTTLFDRVLKSRRKAMSFPLKEYWLDIGRMSDFERANLEYCKFF